MPTYTHRGIEIVFNEQTAKFSAVINGKREQSGSLASIRLRIAAAAEAAFEPWRGVILTNHSTAIEEVEVIGTTKASRVSTGHWRVRYAEKRKYGGQEGMERSVIIDTPENRALIQTWIDAKAHRDAISDVADKAVDDALKAIPFTLPFERPD